jgi:hypothetical protein
MQPVSSNTRLQRSQTKVVVVRLAGLFVNNRCSREVNRRKPSFVQQTLDVPVDCCEPEAFFVGLRRIQHLPWRRWAIGPFEGYTNGGPLPGFPLLSLGHLSQ